MILTSQKLKEISEYEKSLKRIHYEVGQLYEVSALHIHRDTIAYLIAQPAELGHNGDYKLKVGSLILCIKRNYLVEQPNYSNGNRWPIHSFNGLTQGNLFFFSNEIFFIPAMYTYYEQHILLKEIDLNDVY